MNPKLHRMLGLGSITIAELTSLFQALVGTFPSVTTLLTDRALEACQILSHHLTKEI